MQSLLCESSLPRPTMLWNKVQCVSVPVTVSIAEVMNFFQGQVGA